MISTKHKLMSAAGTFNRPVYERIRFLALRGWFPKVGNPRTITEWLLRKKLSGNYVRPELSGTIEGYEHVRSVAPDVLLPTVVANFRRSDDCRTVPNVPDGRYLLKGSHGSGMIRKVTVRHGEWAPSYQELAPVISSWLSTDYSVIGGESCYQSAEKAVLMERIITRDGDLAVDLKVHCLGGSPKILQMIDRRSGTLVRMTWLVDEHLEMKRVSLYRNDSANTICQVELGAISRQALTTSAFLAKDFDYVRVDFLLADDRLYFGEFTHTPAGGCMPLKDFAADRYFLEWCGLN